MYNEEHFMDRYIDDYILDDISVDFMRAISDLSDKLFELSCNSSEKTEMTEQHMRMYYAYRDFVENAIYVIISRCEGDVEWRKGIIDKECGKTEEK